MSKKTDPSMYESQYERRPGDTYYTEPWVTECLLIELTKIHNKTVWEPASGRGDITSILDKYGCTVFSTDIDVSNFNPKSYSGNKLNASQCDFLKLNSDATREQIQFNSIKAIVTNPPYYKAGRRSMAELFVRQALRFDVPIVAMLMRSEFMHVGSRANLFTEECHFAYELLLPKRPRWDWWFRDKPVAQPRHPYSWFVWNKNHVGEPTFKVGKT